LTNVFQDVILLIVAGTTATKQKLHTKLFEKRFKKLLTKTSERVKIIKSLSESEVKTKRNLIFEN